MRIKEYNQYDLKGNSRIAMRVHHASNILSWMTFGLFFFLSYINIDDPEQTQFIMRWFLIGYFGIRLLLSYISRRLDPKILNPISTSKQARPLYFGGVVCTGAALVFIDNESRALYLGIFGLASMLAAIIMSYKGKIQRLTDGEDDILDNIDIEDNA